MAVYKSSHKGSQVDEAVTIANGNKNKGNTNLPIYYDANGVGQSISADTSATPNSNKLLTGGGMYNSLTPKLSNNEIQTTVNTSGLPPSQGAAKKYTDTQLGTLQDPLISSDTINVGSDGKISVTDGVLRRGTSKLDEKVDRFAKYGIGNDSTVLSEMDEAVHSTFCGVNGSGESDPKKFTKVGNPIITTDGIASGFSPSNSVSTTVSLSDELDLSCEFTLGDSFDVGEQEYVFQIHKASVTYFDIRRYRNNINFLYRNTDNEYGLGYQLTNGAEINKTYKLRIVQRGNNIAFYANDVLLGTKDNAAILSSAVYSITFGDSANHQYPLSGSIDLKQFLITDLNGVSVFSGNKTGIDTIKPDNYTIVGSPVITSDGIASGFQNRTNFLRTPIKTTDLLNHSWKIVSCFKPSAVIAPNALNLWKFTNPDSTAGAEGWGGSGFNANNKLLVFQFKTGDTSENSNQLYRTINLSNHMDDYVFSEYSFDYSEGTYNFKAYLSDGTVIGTKSYTAETTNKQLYYINTESTYIITIGAGYANTATTGGEIDLNTFKIYIDGDLVYQPCLKIPYTLSQDGKKIVDNLYRSRVEDEYTQAGYTPYYTLQQELGDNYTVVGSPTITSDGIASGFSDSNYVRINKDIDFTKKIIIKGNFTWINSSTANQICLGVDKNNGSLGISLRPYLGAPPILVYYDGANSSYLNWTNSEVPRVNGVKYDYEIIVDGSNISCTLNGVTKTASNFVGFASSYITLGVDRNFLFPLDGSIDLNAFKIYVDNKLVYTAGCNYTLPTVEEEDIISSAEDGISMYIQRANLALEQTGSCIANTAYTFPKPFMNADYALSIPYTSGTKTATGFTPAESGEYIAEGLGKLY